MAFLDSIGDLLGGVQSVGMQDKYGPDWRTKKAAEDFGLQQRQAEEERAARDFQRQQEEADIAGLAEASLAPGATPESLDAGIGPEVQGARRKFQLDRATGRSAQSKSSLAGQKASTDWMLRQLAGEQRGDQITQTADERRKTDAARLAGVEGQTSSPRDIDARGAALERALAIVSARGGGGGARKPYWNVNEKRTDFLTNEELGSVPPGTYTDVTTGRGMANSGNEGMATIIQNLDDSLANYENSQEGIGMLTPSSMNVAWDRYRSALQSAGQIFGRQFLKDTRVSEQDRQAYAATIGQPSRWLTLLDPKEARRRLGLIKSMAAKYPGVGEVGGDAEGAGSGGAGQTTTYGGHTYRLKPGADRKLKSSWEMIR